MQEASGRTIGAQHFSPMITYRNAHAVPSFAWEEKLTLGITTPEKLDKRIDKITVRIRLCPITHYVSCKMTLCLTHYSTNVFPRHRNWQKMHDYV